MDSFDLLRAAQAAFGIGLVIFVHELGHYIAARMCKVRVETFSLGFGPRLLGWRVGPTMYQVAMVPLGGYCRMAGAEPRWDGTIPEPDELGSKSVGARFFIYSAGVLMNIAFAVITYPIIFSAGVSFIVPSIGSVDPGGPAWTAGVVPGSEVLSVNGSSIYEFPQIATEVALADSAENVLVLRDPQTGVESTVTVMSVRDPSTGLPDLGIRPPLEHDDQDFPVLLINENSPAWNAGLRSGDRVRAVDGATPGLPLQSQVSEFLGLGVPATLQILSGDEERTISVAPEMVTTETRLLGIRPPANLIVAVRKRSSELGLNAHDHLISVAGRTILRAGDFATALAASPGPVEIVVERGGKRVTHTVEMPTPRDATLMRWVSDVAITVDLESAAIVVTPDGAAARAGIQDGDVIREIDDTEIGGWTDTFEFVSAAARNDRTIRIALERTEPNGAPPSYPSVAVKAETMDIPTYGIARRLGTYTYRSPTWGGAIEFGLYTASKTMAQLWVTLQKLVSGDIPAKNMGGIITISRVSYIVADAEMTKFFFFLCVLSMNLALLNILPIPVLDGGHLFFLIIEKIKGTPVSERVFGYSQMVGMVLILSLLVYVTYHDVLRLFQPS